MKGIWLLPSRGRPQALATFFHAARLMGMKTGGIILLHEDDWTENRTAYEALVLPPMWGFATGRAEGLAAALQEAWESGDLADMDWIGILSDDFTPETPEWDTKLITRIDGHNIVAANDGWQAPKRVAACVYSRELISAVGYFAPAGMKHLFFDDVWETLNKDTNCITWALDVMIRHNHGSKTGQQDETAKRVNSLWASDQAAYREWLQSGRHDASKAIFTLIEQKGGKVIRPDLSEVSLMIAVPSHDGRYEAEFVRSYNATRDTLTAAGGKHEVAELTGCADIALARARLFGAFLRSKHTHMLFIDSDMGWLPQDVLRLFEHGHDFTCAAGPKKKMELELAFENASTDGQPQPIRGSDDGLLMEISAVGMAFTMITRSCAERMVESYGESLQFEMEGFTEYGLFDPVYQGENPHRRRFSEDFSFCARWVAIGGKIHLLPHIRLKHVGVHVYEGCFLDILNARAVSAAQAAQQVLTGTNRDGSRDIMDAAE